MHRCSPRVSKPVHAFLVDQHGNEYSVPVENIGLRGACIKADGIPPDLLPDDVLINVGLSFEQAGRVMVQGKIVHRNGSGVGLCFINASAEDQKKIWEYMRDGLAGSPNCPYCNEAIDLKTERCPQCSFDLGFERADYFEHWEKESLKRRMKGMLENIQNPESLRKACLYIEEKILQKEPSPPAEEIEEFVGSCEAMREIFSLIRKVAATDLPVLILGESGTGKELTARAIHERSLQSEKPFIALNCAAIPESLIESELFGHEKGAFTGAHQSRRGKIEQASGGTLFLDEIGELPLNLQPKLLRFLEDRMVDRLGSGKSIQVDVRIIAATNRELEKDVAEGRFRADLYHRLRVFPILLPPLRDRGQDKVILAQYFLKKIKSEREWQCKGFTKEVLGAIQNYSWPGNVREMINKIRRAIVIQDEWITPRDLELEAFENTTCGNNEIIIKSSEVWGKKENLKKSIVMAALVENKFNATRAAKSLAISRTYLYVLCRKYNISTSGNRPKDRLKSER